VPRDVWQSIKAAASVIALARALLFFLVVLGIAIACLAIGDLAGRLIGAAMLVGLALWVWRGLIPWLRNPF
jgi:hypothetical protein